MTQTYSEEQRKEFERISNEMIKFICENGNPHTKVITDCDSSELLGSEVCYKNDSFIMD